LAEAFRTHLGTARATVVETNTTGKPIVGLKPDGIRWAFSP
jgi:hypothetical protein